MPSVYKLEICELEEAGKDLHIIKLANQWIAGSTDSFCQSFIKLQKQVSCHHGNVLNNKIK